MGEKNPNDCKMVKEGFILIDIITDAKGNIKSLKKNLNPYISDTDGDGIKDIDEKKKGKKKKKK